MTEQLSRSKDIFVARQSDAALNVTMEPNGAARPSFFAVTL
jgi:hypothetical protein